MQLLTVTILYVVVITGMTVSLRSFFVEEVIFKTRIMFYTTTKTIKGEPARKFSLYCFIGYFIMFLTLLAYSIFGMKLGYIGIPICMSSFVIFLVAFYAVRNE